MINSGDIIAVSLIIYIKRESQSSDYLNSSISLDTRLLVPVVSHFHITNVCYSVYHPRVFNLLSFMIY